jgi:hypothetical protein
VCLAIIVTLHYGPTRDTLKGSFANNEIVLENVLVELLSRGCSAWETIFTVLLQATRFILCIAPPSSSLSFDKLSSCKWPTASTERLLIACADGCATVRTTAVMDQTKT